MLSCPVPALFVGDAAFLTVEAKLANVGSLVQRRNPPPVPVWESKDADRSTKLSVFLNVPSRLRVTPSCEAFSRHTGTARTNREVEDSESWPSELLRICTLRSPGAGVRKRSK
eukprot:CAMPEP_0172742846 /NCGR_PEP_ID=MMETSP1074-20121228/130598_1 /TAXON_ID=2916 /ORGANISM="Ceratium fusus, Strain PA161109" /LENGTH=112 /DNA_ID=CAMNT_0013573471 /DNA_START=135 /DNA_END=473 /DNA_ORIENTATION=+